MLEKENLTPFQIQLLLYYLTAEPSKRTVTDSMGCEGMPLRYNNDKRKKP